MRPAPAVVARRTSLILAVTAAVVVGCGDAHGGDLVFGAADTACDSIVLTNDPEDEAAVADGSACFLAEVDADRPTVWDVRSVTVEGDPTPVRYDFDGDRVTITTDDRRDEFGSGGVHVQVCDGVEATAWLPAGTDCVGSRGSGFDGDLLP